MKTNTDVRPSVFVPDAKVSAAARKAVSSYNQEYRGLDGKQQLNVLLTYDTDLFTYVCLHFLRALLHFLRECVVRNFFARCVPTKKAWGMTHLGYKSEP